MLRGRLWARGKTAVVLSHMLGTDQSSWADLAGHLAALGYTVLSFDFRGVGASSGRFVIRYVSRDTLGAVRFIRRHDPAKIVLIGASMGGTSSLIAAGETPVDGVVVIASGMTFQGLDVRPYLPHLRMPKLFIVGSGDAPFNESARTMHARTPDPKRLIEIPTAVHGTYMFRTRHKAAIYRGIIEFLTQVSKRTS
jgi:pimeloyl-ACP methyl ester carboxylesterase